MDTQLLRPECKPAVVAVVDDDQSIRVALARLFRSAGIEIESFGSAEEFIDGGYLATADCLIIDVQMPGMSGLQLQQLCQQRRPALPVVMITAFYDDDAENRAMAAGAKAFFHKPFDGISLLNTVRLSLPHDMPDAGTVQPSGSGS